MHIIIRIVCIGYITSKQVELGRHYEHTSNHSERHWLMQGKLNRTGKTNWKYENSRFEHYIKN